nr:probable protein S-acyltransferase 7 [Tanacetum cinerariifolium]
MKRSIDYVSNTILHANKKPALGSSSTPRERRHAMRDRVREEKTTPREQRHARRDKMQGHFALQSASLWFQKNPFNYGFVHNFEEVLFSKTPRSQNDFREFVKPEIYSQYNSSKYNEYAFSLNFSKKSYETETSVDGSDLDLERCETNPVVHSSKWAAAPDLHRLATKFVTENVSRDKEKSGMEALRPTMHQVYFASGKTFSQVFLNFRKYKNSRLQSKLLNLKRLLLSWLYLKLKSEQPAL